MRSHRFRTPLAALACAGVLFLAGCSGDNPVNPSGFTQTDADDIAAQAGMAAAAGVVPNMNAAGGVSGGSAAARFTPQRAGSAAQAETTFTIGAVTYTLGVTFYDADGNVLAGYDPTTAHRMLVTTRATGSVSGQQFEASLEHAGSLDVTGLEASLDTLLFNGACADSVDASFTSLDQQRTRYFLWRSGATLTNTALLKNRQVNPYPLSGTLSYVVHAVRYRSNQFAEVEKTWDATVTIEFDGTATPELTVNGVFHYRLNLLTGAVSRAVA